MAAGRLAGAQRALLALVDRLDPADDFGLVTFDDSATVNVPAGPLTDRRAVKQAISALRPGGSTDLSSGLLRGVQEAHPASAGTGATLLLISDGHANLGTTDPVKLGQVAMAAQRHGVTTTTLGYGLDYDEELMAAIADGGADSALHAADPDTAGVFRYVDAGTLTAYTVTVPVTVNVLPGDVAAGRVPDLTVRAERLFQQAQDAKSGHLSRHR
ncbi:vWA domain-containing protein [Sphaerisporangium sp. NPDC004334]